MKQESERLWIALEPMVRTGIFQVPSKRKMDVTRKSCNWKEIYLAANKTFPLIPLHQPVPYAPNQIPTSYHPQEILSVFLSPLVCFFAKLDTDQEEEGPQFISWPMCLFRPSCQYACWRLERLNRVPECPLGIQCPEIMHLGTLQWVLPTYRTLSAC